MSRNFDFAVPVPWGLGGTAAQCIWVVVGQAGKYASHNCDAAGHCTGHGFRSFEVDNLAADRMV